VLATKPSHEYRSKRERDTAEPTAARLGIEIEDGFTHKDAADAARSILADTRDTMVVWHHGSLPELLSHFPVSNATDIPAQWPEDRFDLVWILTADDNGKFTFSSEPQDLLSDDAPIHP